MAARFFFLWNLLQTTFSAEKKNNLTGIRRNARAAFDPMFIISDEEFQKRFRMSRRQFILLCRELRRTTNLKSSQRATLKEKVLTALFFYATGSYQRAVGVAKHFSQKACSIFIEQVTAALTRPNILKKYIKFPKTVAERQAISQKFYAKYGIPGVIGCIDGSHFHIFKPKNNVEHLYYCRKHFHSLNVQMICDSDGRILNVNPKYGGNCHDAFIWENSDINPYIQSIHRNGEAVWLLGDSGYPQRPWMMTPYSNPNDGHEQRYNDTHTKTRVIIENTFGRIKNKWRCLSKDRVLHYKPLKCARIIQACSVLHNITLKNNTDDQYDNNIQNENVGEIYREESGSAAADLLRGRIVRDQLARRF